MATSALHHQGEQVEAHGLVLLTSPIEGASWRSPGWLYCCCIVMRVECIVRCSTVDGFVRGPGGKGIDQDFPPLPIPELRVFSLDRMFCVCEASPRPYPPPRAWPFFGALGFWVWPWRRGVMTGDMLWRRGGQ